jgi:hypothetical protein
VHVVVIVFWQAEGWVYMLTESECGRYVKIGFSKYGARIQNTFNPREVVEVDKFPADRDGETNLHQRLSRFRVRGEWFVNSPLVERLWNAEKRFWSETVIERTFD